LNLSSIRLWLHVVRNITFLARIKAGKCYVLNPKVRVVIERVLVIDSRVLLVRLDLVIVSFVSELLLVMGLSLILGCSHLLELGFKAFLIRSFIDRVHNYVLLLA